MRDGEESDFVVDEQLHAGGLDAYVERGGSFVENGKLGPREEEPWQHMGLDPVSDGLPWW